MLARNPDSWRKLLGEATWPRKAWARALRAFGELAPKGLYARALIIIIAPIVLLESVVAFTFMERHWNQVTRRLSEGLARDMAAIVDLYEQATGKEDIAQLIDIAQNRFGFSVAVLPAGNLPTPQPKPFFDLLDRALSDEIRAQVKRPFWIDTVGQSRHVEIRVKLDHAILRFVAQRGLAYASNSHIFLIWMVGTSVVLLTVAILFLRNQIRPVLRLAEAADAFGKGRPFPPEFRPRGAREVRQAAQAFLEMRERIRHHVEQRTTMLAGVSHDLRTVLTRFKLELALLRRKPGDPGAQERRQRDAAHAGGLPRLRQGRRRRGGRADQRAASCWSEVQEETEHLGTPIEVRMRQPKQRAGAALEAAGLQARRHQPRHQRRPLRQRRHHPRRPWTTSGCASRSTTTGRASRRPSATTSSARSTASTTPATRMPATPAWGWRSPATSPAATAATSRSAPAPWAACAPPCACRCKVRLGSAATRRGTN